jgi:hypothetical protein
VKSYGRCFRSHNPKAGQGVEENGGDRLIIYSASLEFPASKKRTFFLVLEVLLVIGLWQWLALLGKSLRGESNASHIAGAAPSRCAKHRHGSIALFLCLTP